MEVNKYLNNIRMWPCYNLHSRLLCAKGGEVVNKYMNFFLFLFLFLNKNNNNNCVRRCGETTLVAERRQSYELCRVISLWQVRGPSEGYKGNISSAILWQFRQVRSVCTVGLS